MKSKKLMTITFLNAVYVSNHDGDTCKIYVERDLDFGFNFFIKGYKTQNFRMNGINCSEVRGGTVGQKERAQRAKIRVEELLKPLPFRLDSHKPSKFGNYLCDIYLADGTHVNQLLIDEGLAVFYDGTTQRLARTTPKNKE
ncbi:MAG TPA: thermonuclease family protein [Pyrinomonadaceae bacterium]|nr:thermonuclease family protein [Pyrinomonadaceae bacterium]